jgi:predicted ATPase/DNA-binding SARP family transcriptional activator
MSYVVPSGTKIRLRFLGGCQVLLPGGPARLETAKTRALLVYLTMSPKPVERHKLMGLLWGDLPEPNARRNLRRALWNLRRQLTLADTPPPIIADRKALEFDWGSPSWCDVRAFQAACTQLVRLTQEEVSKPELAGIRSGVELYQGDFLDGFFINDAPPFEDWVLVEAERLRLLAIRALQKLGDMYEVLEAFEPALVCAQRLLAVEPWREETHQQVMRLLARTDQREAALAQFETCRRILAEELDVEPSSEMYALYEQIKSGWLTTSPLNLPAQTTPFVGRKSELDEINDLLDDPACRLLTISGLGGAGKTRLALQVATQRAEKYLQGVFFVPLAAQSSSQEVVSTVIKTLGLSLFGPEDPRVQLMNYLRGKSVLLVLDNFEHLLKSGELVAEMLSHAPNLAILVTSRQRLNLPGEWVFELSGLGYAEDESIENVVDFDAVQLFLQTARRVRLGYTLKEGEKPSLTRICRLVEGLPLAIELAAAWVRVLPLEEIAREIENSPEIFEAPLHAVSHRHRSMQAVFDHSWRLLSDQEQRVFRKLSVFRREFTREGAEKVAGATLAVLTALVDKSMLGRVPSGRYKMHELLRQYAATTLERVPQEGIVAHHDHSQYFTDSLKQYGDALSEGGADKILSHLERIETQMDDIQDAWRWAINQEDQDAIVEIALVMYSHFQMTTTFREGASFFRTALEGLGWLTGEEIRAGEGGFLPWMLLNRWASFNLYLGRIDQARNALERCLPALRGLQAEDETALCLFTLGEIARFSGDYPQAQELLGESVTLHKKAGNRGGAAFALNVLGVVSTALEEYVQAQDYLEESLAVFKGSDHIWGQAVASINLAVLYKGLGDNLKAVEILKESLSLCRTLGHRWGMATCLNHLGDIASLQDGIVEAKDRYQESLTILQDIGNRQGIVRSLINLGAVTLALDDDTEAGELYIEAVKLAVELQAIPGILEAAVGLAEVFLRLGELESAAEILTWVEAHPQGEKATIERAKKTLIGTRHELSSARLERIREKSQGRAVEDILAPYL